MIYVPESKNGEVCNLSVAGVQGFEPQSADPESVVLPLNDTPLLCNSRKYSIYYLREV